MVVIIFLALLPDLTSAVSFLGIMMMIKMGYFLLMKWYLIFVIFFILNCDL